MLETPTKVLMIMGDKLSLDAGVVFCKNILIEELGEELGESAFRCLPALDGLIFYKSRDRRGLKKWAQAWMMDQPN